MTKKHLFKKKHFIDLKKIKLGFCLEDPIAAADELFFKSIKHDRNFKNLQSFYEIRPQSEIRTKCCNKELYFHRGVTQKFLWSFYASPQVIGTLDFFSEFKKNQWYAEHKFPVPDLSCGCEKFKQALLMNNEDDFYKYFPIEELKFFVERSTLSGYSDFNYYGLAEFERVFGESTTLVDDGRCIYTFSKGKLNGSYLRYLVVEGFEYEDPIDLADSEDLFDSMLEFNEQHAKKPIHEDNLHEILYSSLSTESSVKLLYEFLDDYISQSKFVIQLLDECHDLYGKILDQHLKKLFKEFMKSIKKGDNLFESLFETVYIVVEKGTFKNNLKHGTFETLKNQGNEELNLITTTTWENGKLVK